MELQLLLLVLLQSHLCFSEKRDLIPLKAPQNLTLLEIKDKQVVIEWDEVDPESVRGTFRGYIVRTWNHVGSQVYAFPRDVTKANVEFFPYSKNFITVSTRNEKYVGPPSEAISFQAPQIEPNLPYELNAFPLSEKSLLIRWSKPVQPNGLLLGYKIYCSIINDSLPLGEEESNEVSHEILDPDKLQAKLTGMVEGVKYKIGVTAINCAGESERRIIYVTLEPHSPAEPFTPKFIYKIDYKTMDAEQECASEIDNSIENSSDKSIEQNDYDYFILNETKPIGNDEKITTETPSIEDHCLVDCMIMWLPDIRNNPGEYFYLKYRMRGEKEFQTTEPELSEDFIILENFNACKNYEIILTAVDGEFTTDSRTVVTPTKIY